MHNMMRPITRRYCRIAIVVIITEFFPYRVVADNKQQKKVIQASGKQNLYGFFALQNV